jgi:hypothetical protein
MGRLNGNAPDVRPTWGANETDLANVGAFAQECCYGSGNHQHQFLGYRFRNNWRGDWLRKGRLLCRWDGRPHRFKARQAG